MTKNMKRMTALACAAMMIASMGITGCGKADGQCFGSNRRWEEPEIS